MNYKKGDRIVSLGDHSQGTFKRGDEFICEGFSACPSCGDATTYLSGLNEICRSVCKCGFSENGVRQNYKAKSFIKKPSHGELTEYRLSVSAPELTEIKTPQLS
jgi:hypothetical protein